MLRFSSIPNFVCCISSPLLANPCLGGHFPLLTALYCQLQTLYSKERNKLSFLNSHTTELLVLLLSSVFSFQLTCFVMCLLDCLWVGLPVAQDLQLIFYVEMVNQRHLAAANSQTRSVKHD